MDPPYAMTARRNEISSDEQRIVSVKGRVMGSHNSESRRKFKVVRRLAIMIDCKFVSVRVETQLFLIDTSFLLKSLYILRQTAA